MPPSTDPSKLTVNKASSAPNYLAGAGTSLSLPTAAAPKPNPYGGIAGFTPAAPMATAAPAPRAFAAPKPPASPITGKPLGAPGATTAPAPIPGAAPVAAANPSLTLTSGGGFSTGHETAPSSFYVDTGKLSSDALTSRVTSSEAQNQASDYFKYAQQLATASGYSPEYLGAFQQSKNIEAQMAALRGDLATGAAPGDTQGFAEGFTSRAIMGAGAQKSFADIALATQELMRQGNIEGAKALLGAFKPETVSPGSSLVSPATGNTVFGGAGAYSDYQAQQTYFNLAQNFPDANIPGYNPALPAQQNLQLAQQAAQSSPSFQSRSTIPVTLPGGGYALVNKNQVAGYRPDGTAVIVSPAVAAQAQGAQQAIASLTKDRADTQAAISAADSNFPLLLQAVKDAGLNNNAPLVNEINQKIANKTSQSTAMAALNTLIPSLQTEYSRIIARGGTVDDKTRTSAQSIVNGTYTFNQLKAVFAIVQKEGHNVIKGYDDEINRQSENLNRLYSTESTKTTTSSGGSIWDF